MNTFPKKTYRWLKTHEKMLNITAYKENANQNHNDVSPHICHNCYHQKVYKEKMLEKMWRKEDTCTLCTVEGNAN